MNIFTHLAATHITKTSGFRVGGDSPWIAGKNDLRPLDPPEAPVHQKPDTQGPMGDMVVQRHKDTMHGELHRAFDNYLPSVRDYHSTIGQLMAAKIEEISGSSAASQALVRHQG